MRFLKKNYGLFIVLILSFWAIKPFFISGFFPMHDDTQVARVFEMGKMLKSGVFPVRWVPDLGYGYGYPIFNFYAPIAYYIGGIFILLGFDALLATKLMMALGVVSAGIFMYFLAREFFGELGGIVSGLFYVYAPYHAVDIYVRGDVAEFYAYAFIPLIFLGFYKVFQCLRSDGYHTDNSKFKVQNAKLKLKIQKFGIIGSLGFAGIILSHNLTALMTVPFLIAFCLAFIIFSKKETRMLNVLHLTLYIFLGLAISAFYWIPALAEMKNTNILSQIGGGADFRDHFVCIEQLWTSSWGFGGSTRGCVDGMSFAIGKLHIVFVLSTMLILIYLKLKHKYLNDIYYLSIFSITGFLISIFLMLDVSGFLWETIPAMAFFQYPWRFLLLASFFSSLLSGFVIWFLQLEKPGLSTYFKLGLCISVVIFLLLFLNVKLFNPQTILPKTPQNYTSERSLKWVASKISDEFLSPNFKKPKSEFEVSKKPLPFKETIVQKVSNVVSLVGIAVLIIGIILLKGKAKYE